MIVRLCVVCCDRRRPAAANLACSPGISGRAPRAGRPTASFVPRTHKGGEPLLRIGQRMLGHPPRLPFPLQIGPLNVDHLVLGLLLLGLDLPPQLIRVGLGDVELSSKRLCDSAQPALLGRGELELSGQLNRPQIGRDRALLHLLLLPIRRLDAAQPRALLRRALPLPLHQPLQLFPQHAGLPLRCPHGCGCLGSLAQHNAVSRPRTPCDCGLHDPRGHARLVLTQPVEVPRGEHGRVVLRLHQDDLSLDNVRREGLRLLVVHTVQLQHGPLVGSQPAVDGAKLLEAHTCIGWSEPLLTPQSNQAARMAEVRLQGRAHVPELGVLRLTGSREGVLCLRPTRTLQKSELVGLGVRRAGQLHCPRHARAVRAQQLAHQCICPLVRPVHRRMVATPG
eukprot:scaffold35866_cov124-Isochrysis_galbana.AAC.8